MDQIEIAPLIPAAPVNAARLNVTWNGANGDLPDPVPYDATDAELKRMASESIETGYIPGIPADAQVNLNDFIVDRFAASAEIPHPRVFIRPKTPFGF